MKTQSANGIKGCLIWSGEEYLFRVYDGKHDFKDYKLRHSDLFVTIDELDAFFYEYEDGDMILDHAPETLGITNKDV